MDGYRLIASLGRGGMAEVFLAARAGRSGNLGVHKLVVIKRLRADLAAAPEAGRYRALLLDEGRLAARLRHPNIVETFEVDDDADGLFVVMEYLEGQSVSQVARQARRMDRKIPIELSLRVVADVLGALDYAHDLADYDGTPLRVVHRDVSPQNVFWTYDGEIKLVDFGVAKSAHNREETAAGVVKGKLTYMAPEQARGAAIDRRADVFAAGIMLWELASNRRLFRAQSSAVSMQRLLFEEIPKLTRVKPDADPELERICDRALQREVGDRYQSAAEMRADIEHVLRDESPRRESLGRFVQSLFVEQRAQIAERIRDALAGGTQIVQLGTAELTSSKQIEIARTTVGPGTSAQTVAEPAAALTQRGLAETAALQPSDLIALPYPQQAPPRSRRTLIAGLGAVIAALVAIDLVVWTQRSHGSDNNGGNGSAAAPAGALASAAGSTAPAAAAGSANAATAEHLPALAHAPALRLCGSNTVGAELAPALVRAFLEQKGATNVHRDAEPEHSQLTATLNGNDIAIDIRARGTATAFEGLVAGTCDIGMASRAINAKELAATADKGLGDLSEPGSEHVIGLDGIAVIVHPNNKVAALDRAQLHDIFAGKITDWSQVGGAPGPIALYARDAKSGTFDTFKSLVLGQDKIPDATKRFADSNALADAVANDPTAIGFIGLAYIRSAKALAVSDPGATPMLPTPFTVTTEEYMLSRRLLMYTPATAHTPLVTELVSFILSSAGQAVVRDTSFIDLNVALRDGEPCDARCPAGYVALTAHAQRLSLDFRFRSGSDGTDSRATRDLDRVVQFLRAYPDAKLILLGFSDSAGDPAANKQLSKHRAQAIAKELATRGVHVAVSDGFGAAMPIAANNSDADRERNRRVEVWLQR